MGILLRIKTFYNTNSLINTLRKIIYSLIDVIIIPQSFYRKCRFYFFTKCWVKNVKGQIKISGISNYTILGKDSYLYERTVFEFGEKAKLTIGKNFTFSYGSILACQSSISIGDFVMIGEYCSIRDTTHTYYQPLPYCLQKDTSIPITIGDNVWIGRGCIILPGTTIENDVIIAANSVVKGLLEKGCLYGGSPAKLIKQIKEIKIL